MTHFWKSKDFWNDQIELNVNYNRNRVNWLMDFKYKFKLFYIKYCRDKLLFSRRHDQMLENCLNNVLISLEQNPSSKLLAQNYYKIKKQLVDSKIKKTKEKILKSEAQYIMQGEKPIKSFFEKFKNKKENKLITSFLDKEGNECFDMKGIIKITEDYYKELFSVREIRQPIMNLFLNNIKPLIGFDQLMANLTVYFSLDEIWDAIVSVKRWEITRS